MTGSKNWPCKFQEMRLLGSKNRNVQVLPCKTTKSNLNATDSLDSMPTFAYAASSAGALWRMMAADDKQPGDGLGVRKRIVSAEGESALQLLMKVCLRRVALLFKAFLFCLMCKVTF